MQIYLILFWVSLLTLIYIYFGYPLLLHVISKMKKSTVMKADKYYPMVTIIIAAYNEEKHIESTILNKLKQNYLENKLEIIVISDESTDKTDDIVNDIIKEYPHQVRLLRQKPRNGKTAALNLAIPYAKGEIIVFSDANSLYDDNAIKNLVNNFNDPSIGYVTGKMIYVKNDTAAFGDGCTSYMKYENILRDLETKVGSVVGVDGGIDAVRKELYIPMRADQIPDFVLPLNVVTQGYRVVYEPNSVLKEEVLDDDKDEYNMRVRVGLRSLWALKENYHLLNPLKYGLFSLQLFSHKTLRYFAFVPLALVLIANIMILGQHFIYNISLVLQVLFYSLAYMGRVNRYSKQPIYTSLPYYFMLINLATLSAFLKFIRGEKKVTWNPRVG